MTQPIRVTIPRRCNAPARCYITKNQAGRSIHIVSSNTTRRTRNFSCVIPHRNARLPTRQTEICRSTCDRVIHSNRDRSKQRGKNLHRRANNNDDCATNRWRCIRNVTMLDISNLVASEKPNLFLQIGHLINTSRMFVYFLRFEESTFIRLNVM